MLNIILYFKRFLPFSIIKKRLFASEFFLDLIYYKKTVEIFKDKKFKAFNVLKPDFDRDLGLVFFVGIGDVIYGMPALLELKKKLKDKGYNFHAYVEEIQSNFANPAVFDLLEESGIFDTVNYFHGRKLQYWKYYDWTSIKSEKNMQILPFIYKTNHKVSDRILEVFRQYGLSAPITWPNFNISGGVVFDTLCEILNREPKGKNIFIHLETRSGEYIYPFIDDVLSLIISSKSLNTRLNLVVFRTDNLSDTPLKDEIKRYSRNRLRIVDFKNGNRIIFINPKNLSFSEQVSLIKNHCDLILAINSYLWPISKMLSKDLVGIHYLDSADGHQFSHEKSFLITPSSQTHKNVTNSIFAIEGVDYTRLQHNHLMVEYSASSIYAAFLHKSHLLKN